MRCPYLAEVTMVFCRASAIRKAIPADRLACAGPCDAEFPSCPLFAEALARARDSAADPDARHSAGAPSCSACNPFTRGEKS